MIHTNRMTLLFMSNYNFKYLCGTVGKAHGYYTIRTYPFEQKRIGSGFETQNKKHYFLSYAVCYNACVYVCVFRFIYIFSE